MQILNTTPIVHITSLSARVTFWRMERKKVNIFQQIRNLSISSCMCVISELKTKQGIQRSNRSVSVRPIWWEKNMKNEEKLKHDSTHSISLIIFYDNRKSLIFKLMVVVFNSSLTNLCVLIMGVFKKKQSCSHFT